jgi:O-succinylbenzoic acid--CoA ligase
MIITPNHIAQNPAEQQAIHWLNEWSSEKQDFTIMTSGSTGAPKSIHISRKQMQCSALLTLKALQLKEGDSMLINLNCDYIAGKMMLVRGMEGKMKMHFTEPTSNPLQNIENMCFDFLSFVPMQMETILIQSPEKMTMLNAAKAIIIGGAPISLSLETALQNITAPVYHTYGMSETVSHIALRRVNGKARSDYFNTLHGITIGVDDRNCLTVNHEVSGNQEVISNDIIAQLSPTSFKWLGRADDVINSGGVKIIPAQVEEKLAALLLRLGIQNRFFVFPLPHDTLGNSVNLLIEANGIPFAIPALKEEIVKVLPPFERPKLIFEMAKFIETNTQKIDRNKTISLISV